MFKKILILFISLLLPVMLAGCSDTDTRTLSEEEKAALASGSFTSDAFFEVNEGDKLTDGQIREVISGIPSDKYESYPDTHNIPLSATLYKDGKEIPLEIDDPRLIGLVNFFNNCVYHSKCSYIQSLLPIDHLEEKVIGNDFRLELKYTPSSDTVPSAYGTCTTGCDTIIVTDGFTLIAHDLPGYEDQADRYPFRAVGFSPLYNDYPWLDLFGF